MISNKKMVQSQQLRQKILDICTNNILLLTEIADLISIDKSKLNHHLLSLVAHGYLTKHLGYKVVRRASANGYSTIKPVYEWSYSIAVEEVVEEQPQPVAMEHQELMIKMGYTNIIPSRGRVHHGIMSIHAEKRENL